MRWRRGSCNRAAPSSRGRPATPGSACRWWAPRWASARSSSSPRPRAREKKDMLRLAGAHLVQVPAAPHRNPNNYVRYSGRLAEALARTEERGAIWANQFDNTANRQAHVETTGPEIWGADRRQGRRLHLCRGLGRHARGRGHGASAQGREDRPRRSRGRGAAQLLHRRHLRGARQLDHRRHRAGPDHRQPRGADPRLQLPHPPMPRRCRSSST